MLSHWTENDITVNGTPFHYYRTGDGSKPVLVLAHGFSDNGLCWLPVACDLEAEYDVILPDARGHGKSARVTPGETVDNAADLAGIIEGLGLARLVVGGHSMGANSASSLAARWPQLVRALILEDPGWRDPAPEPEPNPWLEWLQKLPSVSVEQVMAKARKDNPTWPEIELRPWAESKKQLDLNIMKAAPAHMEWREVVKAILCPTLLITADANQGGIVTPQMARTAILLNRRIEVVNIAGVGHSIRREDYAGYMQAVRAFLAEVEAPPEVK